jgi:hypothetical protein
MNRGKNFAEIYSNAKDSPLQFTDMFHTGAPTLPALSKTELRQVFVRYFVNSLDVFNSVTRERQSLTTFNWSFSTF